MPRVFATRAFDRWAHKERIRDGSLLDAVEGADAGLIDANLGGCLIKLRIARPSAGKRDGYRSIVAYRRGDKAFFLYGFGKNDRTNIGRDEAEGYEELGSILLAFPEQELTQRIKEGNLRELKR